MENENSVLQEVIKKIVDKKIDGYGFNENNYLDGRELKVEITLSEYRELVAHNATRDTDIRKANERRWEVEAENEKLKKEIESLRNEIQELHRNFADMPVTYSPEGD